MELILIAILALFKTTSALECQGHRPQYKVKDDDGYWYCRECSKCPPGHGVFKECTEFNDTVCARCIPGINYSSSSSVDDTCVPCTMCSPNQEVLRNCTTTNNSQCGECKIGYFLDELSDFCDECWYCYPGISIYISDCDRPGVLSGYHCMQINNPPYLPPAPTDQIDAKFKLKHYPTQEESLTTISATVNTCTSSVGTKENMTSYKTIKEPGVMMIASNSQKHVNIAWIIVPVMLITVLLVPVVIVIIFKLGKFSKKYYARPLNSISKDVEHSDGHQTKHNNDTSQVGGISNESNSLVEHNETCSRGSSDNCLNSQVPDDYSSKVMCKTTNTESESFKVESLCPDETAKLFVNLVSSNCSNEAGKLEIPLITRHISSDSAYDSEYDEMADDYSISADDRHLIQKTQLNSTPSRQSQVDA